MRKDLGILCLTMAALCQPLAYGETLFGFTGTGATTNLVRFDSATPGTVTNIGVTGIAAGNTLLGIDFRPANGLLYGFFVIGGGVTGNLVTIDPVTGVATVIGSDPVTAPNGGFRGFDFNPAVDAIRVTTDSAGNYRYSPTTGGILGTDSNLGFVAGDPNFGQNAHVGHAAYTNNVPGAPGGTTLFGIATAGNESTAASLVRIGGVNGPPSPNLGELTTIGLLGLSLTSLGGGFDISGSTGTAFAALTVGSSSNLYTINLSTGAATLVGAIGAANINGLTVAPAAIPEPATIGLALMGLAALAARRFRKLS